MIGGVGYEGFKRRGGKQGRKRLQVGRRWCGGWCAWVVEAHAGGGGTGYSGEWAMGGSRGGVVSSGGSDCRGRRGSGTGCGWQPVPSGEEGGWALALGRAVTAATFDPSGCTELGRAGRKQKKEESVLPAGKEKVRCVGGTGGIGSSPRAGLAGRDQVSRCNDCARRRGMCA